MAAKRSSPQLKELAAFIQALYDAGGYSTWAEFADDARVHRVSISEWKNGNSGADGVNLLKLIRAAAARAGVQPEALALDVARAPEFEALIADRLEVLASGVSEALILLRAIQQPARAGQRTPGNGPR